MTALLPVPGKPWTKPLRASASVLFRVLHVVVFFSNREVCSRIPFPSAIDLSQFLALAAALDLASFLPRAECYRTTNPRVWPRLCD